MGWMDYYRLLDKYGGDIEKATPKEREAARRANPNTPASALFLAQRKWDRRQKQIKQEGEVIE